MLTSSRAISTSAPAGPSHGRPAPKVLRELGQRLLPLPFHFFFICSQGHRKGHPGEEDPSGSQAIGAALVLIPSTTG